MRNCPRSILAIANALLLGASAVTTAGGAESSDGLLLRLSFDGDAKPASVDGTVTFVDGASGKAILVGERHAKLRVPVEGNVVGRQGSVSMWIKAVDWEPAEKKFHVFFHATEGGWLQLYTHQAQSLMMLTGSDPNNWQAAEAPSSKLTKGRWHHVVGTWSPGNIVLYVDGQRLATVGVQDKHVAKSLSGDFEIGDFPWATGRANAKTTAIDELRIYSRAIGDVEVRNLYSRIASMLVPDAEEQPAPAPTSRAAALAPQDPKALALFREILFRAPYEGSADAQVYIGDPKAKTEGKVVFEPGRHGQAIAVGEEFTRLTYMVGSHTAEPNVSLRRGSLSFWFKPVNWDPGEKRSHLFFRVKQIALCRVFIDNNGELAFEIGTDLDQKNGVRTELAGLKRGEWIHVAATWSGEEIRLYLNKKLAAQAPNQDRYLPYAVNTTFEVGDIPRAVGREKPRKTLIDDLTFYRRPLEADELDRVPAPKSAGKAPPYAPPAVTIPLALKSPVVDGVIRDGEWRFGAELTNFASVSDHKLAPIQTEARVAYDEKNIYFAVVSPILPGVALSARYKNRDETVWSDDAIQIYLTTPAGHTFTFIGNSIGTIFDRKYHKGIKHDVTWNGDWQYAVTTKDATWTAEVGIAFAELETKPPADGETWRLNVTRDRVTPQNLSAWPALSGFSDTVKHGHLTFAGRTPVVAAAPSFERILSEKLDLSAAIAGAALAETTTVEIQWLAAQAGKIVLLKTDRIAVEAGKETSVRLREKLPITPDLVSFTASATDGGAVLYKSMSLLGRRQGMTVNLTPIPSKNICTITLSVSEPGLLAADPDAVVKLIPRGKDAPALSVRSGKLEGGRAATQFKLSDLAPGTYDVRVELATHGKVIAAKTDEFVKPDEPWRGTKLGLSDVPPPPWPPIESKQADDGSLTVESWNRTYAFGHSPLPASIGNGAVQVLAGPVRIDATVAGNAQTWRDEELRVTGRDKNKIAFETKSASSDLSLHAKTYVEFDGMLWTDLTITASKPVRVESLDLVVPIKAACAKYRHWPGDESLTGNLERDDEWIWKHEPSNYAYLWLGNDDLGLTWFFETWGQFKHAETKGIVELSRRDGVVYLKIHYVGKPVELDGPLTLSFGLQATPTRPRPKGWRSWGGGNVVGTNVDVPWTSEEFHRYGAGFPEAANPDYFRRYMKDKRDNGWKAVPYTVILWHAEYSPAMRYNMADWDLGGGINKYSDIRKFWWGRRICGAADSYGEFYAYKAHEYLKTLELDGLYHDLQWSYRCGSANHGPGELHRAIRGDRELNKRIYTMMKNEFDRPTWKFNHASNLICSVTSPFSDLFTTGEEMRRYPPEGEHPKHKVYSNYFHNMRLDYFKACGATGRQWGVAPALLTQMVAFSPGYTEAMYAILIAHDAIPIWEALMKDLVHMRRVQRTMTEFGIGADDVEFLPYWHDTTPAKVSLTPTGGGPVKPFQVKYDVPEHAKLLPEESFGASVYRRAGKRSLVVVFNYTQDDGAAKVKLDLAGLGLDPARTLATDAYSRFVWARADREIELSVKSLNYRLIWVEQLPKADFDRAKVRQKFPPYPDEKMLAGCWPVDLGKDRIDVEIVGDLRKDPWSQGPDAHAGPQRSELAQTFTLARPSRVCRVRAYLRDSDGATAIRKAVRVSIVKLAPEGLPGDLVVASPRDFAPTWFDSRTWRYASFELSPSKVLAPGRYALVFSKPPESPEEFFHTKFPVVSAKKQPGEYALTREEPARGQPGWKKAPDRITIFGVYGVELPE